MLPYNTYIDESGNTGNNLVDPTQKYFTLAAVSIPQNEEMEILSFIEQKFDSVKEIGETEIKTSRWAKSPKKAVVLQLILDYLLAKNCDFALVLLEKRYMVCGLIVDNFLDGAYNDFEDYTWCNDRDEKKKAAQYFYDILDDNDIEIISRAFTHPELVLYKQALDIVFCKTSEPDYKRMLAGCHIEEVFEVDYDFVMKNPDLNSSVTNSANYVSFSALGAKVAKRCMLKGYETNIIFDSCLLCNDAYKYIFELFNRIDNNIFLQQWAGLISWKEIVNSFTIDNSKNSFLLQTSDILATSVMKTMEKVFSDTELSDYDKYIKSVIRNMLGKDTFHFVMADRNVEKMVSFLSK